MKKVVALSFSFLFAVMLQMQAQTTVIDPAGDGGFETGTTFAANGWTVVNSATSGANKWWLGSACTPASGSRCGYISNSTTGATHNYDNSASAKCHLYRNVSFPNATEDQITLTFSWRSNGEIGNSDDALTVYLTDNTFTPSTSSFVNPPAGTLLGTFYNQNTWQTATINIDPAMAGQTNKRLIFTWKNDAGSGSQQPAAIDNISLKAEHLDMQYGSASTTQASTASVCPNDVNRAIIGIQIVTVNGASNPLVATDFEFNTGSGSTNAATDIANAKLFYTGTSNTFSTTMQVGSTVSAPNGSFTISPAQTLAFGTNYFWLAYDIASTAQYNNNVDCECNSLTVGGLMYTPSVTDPAGVRNIPTTCPPPNDDCANATPIPSSGYVTGSNVNADVGIQPDDPNSIFEATCNSSVDNTVFYTFTTTSAGNYSVCFSDISCNNSNGIQASIFNTSTCHTTNNWGANLACEEPMNTNNFCVSANGLAAGTTYYVSVDGYAGCKCTWGVSVQNITLPVSLISFDATANDCGALLSWTTASETNNSYFTISQNVAGIMSPIGVVQGAGNTNELRQYSFKIDDLAEKDNYFQLSQTDFDGTTVILGLKNVVNDCAVDPIQIQFQDNSLLIDLSIENAKAELVLFDVAGRICFKSELADAHNMLNFSHLETGLYFCVVNMDGIQKMLRFAICN